MNFTIKKFLKTLLPLLISYSLDENPLDRASWFSVQARLGEDSGKQTFI